MANWTILKQAIASVIKANSNQEITGTVLQNTLNNIVNNIGENAAFAGIATPTTNPGTPDGPVFYIAIKAGTYANFGGLSINEESAIFVNTGSTWSKHSIGLSSEKVININSVKSNIGWIKTYSTSAIIVDNKAITINNDGWDLYHANRFFRGSSFAKPQTINLLDSSCFIYLDIRDNMFKISNNQNLIDENTIIIGFSYFDSVTIFATSYTNSNKVVGLDYAIDFSSNPDIPGFSAYFSNAYASIDTKNNIATINGDVYVVSRKNNFKRLANTEYQFASQGTSFIVFNYIDNTFRSADYVSKKGDCIIGTKSSNGKLYFNGEIRCEYVDGSTVLDNVYNYISESKIANITKNTYNLENTPDFIINSATETFIRLVDWVNGENTFLLAQITDVHSGGTLKYKAVKWLNSINSLFNFDILCNCGDIGLDTANTNGNKKKTYELVVNTKRLMHTNSPWLFTKGNHEKIEENGISSDKKLGEIFNKSEKRIFDNIILSSNSDYGYIDKNNIRTIFLNTSENITHSGYSISTNQLQWLINTISNTPSDSNIVIVSHLCIDKIGRWNSYPNDADGENFDALREIFKSLANHTAGSNSSLHLQWDFKSLNSKLVCCLSGDSHFNNYIKHNGVNYIVRQGYGHISSDDIATGGTFDNFDWTKQCLFDVLAVKENGNAKLFRIGVGGSDRDILFTY